MPALQLIALGRQRTLYRDVAAWPLDDVERYFYDSPSEALAALATGGAALFLFDTSGFTRFRHVIRKFLSLRQDTDLVVIGDESALAEIDPDARTIAVRRVDPDASADELRMVVERLLQLRRVRNRSGIVGRSRAVTEMLSLIAHAAPLDVNILIQGESGTGKELVARAIHTHSPRRDGPFVSLNCGAMSEGVLESELFGHVRGAFTGAVADHAGVFARADGGTLFLDEVGEMPLGMQTRFLRALETGEYTPVGGRETRRGDIRLVAASNRDLGREVEAGRFRQDLYYRLRVVVIVAPPLRERAEDVPLLASAFLAEENREHGLAIKGIARAAMQMLEVYAWPGNVRELRNVIRSAAVLKQTGLIEAEDLPDEIRRERFRPDPRALPVPVPRDRESLERELLTTTLLELREDIKEIKEMLRGRVPPAWSGGSIPVGEGMVETYHGDAGYSPVGGEGGDLQTAERTLIEAALKATGGRRKAAAERLGISERTLYRKIKKYGL